jgi:F-type H+-transporting ATPase subunit gamma
LKGHDILRRSQGGNIIGSIKNEKIKFSNLKHTVNDLLSEGLATCNVFYTHFKSAFALIPAHEQIFPFIGKEDCLKFKMKNKSEIDYSTEPCSTEIMPLLAKQYAYAKLYRILKDSISSENMSRMMAMDNATNNANDVIDELKLLYNRTRQAKVTKELIEIISGMEAL